MMRLIACAEDPHKYRRKSFLFGRVWDGCEHSSTAFRCGMFRIQIRRERKTEEESSSCRRDALAQDKDRESSAFDISERTGKTCTSFTCLVISGLLIVREDTTWSRGNAGISTITTLDLYFGHHVLQRRNHSVNNRSIYDSLCLLLAVNDGVETRAADMYNMFWILAREHGVQRGEKDMMPPLDRYQWSQRVRTFSV
jgi:hypothetical protein